MKTIKTEPDYQTALDQLNTLMKKGENNITNQEA